MDETAAEREPRRRRWAESRASRPDLSQADQSARSPFYDVAALAAPIILCKRRLADQAPNRMRTVPSGGHDAGNTAPGGESIDNFDGFLLADVIKYGKAHDPGWHHDH